MNNIKYRKIKSSDVTITHHKLPEPQEFYCISVPGQSFVVEDDEGNQTITGNTLHVSGVSKVFRTFCEEHPRIVNDELKSKIYQMAKDSVTLEDKFIKLAFKNNEVQGLAQEEIKKYIRYIADRRLLQLGLKPKYNVKDNPLTWLDWVVNGASHDNFFEKRVTEYSVNGMEGQFTGYEEYKQ